MEINALYSTYQGEQNVYGIGKPVIFLRTSLCHIRCYAKTLGVLCDTPEALEKGSGKVMTVDEVVAALHEETLRTGIKYICLSGGDPLMQDHKELFSLFELLLDDGYEISIETSGTLPIGNLAPLDHVYWVLDYKLKSCGIARKFVMKDLRHLGANDIIKFVIYDDEDYDEFLTAYGNVHSENDKIQIAVGCYWGGKMKSSHLVERLIKDNLFSKVLLNMQAHKLLTLADNVDVSAVDIPRLL